MYLARKNGSQSAECARRPRRVQLPTPPSLSAGVALILAWIAAEEENWARSCRMMTTVFAYFGVRRPDFLEEDDRGSGQQQIQTNTIEPDGQVMKYCAILDEPTRKV